MKRTTTHSGWCVSRTLQVVIPYTQIEQLIGPGGVATFLRTLNEIGYTGSLAIEREIPQERGRQKEEISRGMQLRNELKAKINVC